jgi:hypothetical protein
MPLPLFDEWYAEHQESCDVTRLDVSLEYLVEGVTQIQVRCPGCGASIIGSIAADLFDVASRLAPGRDSKAG